MSRKGKSRRVYDEDFKAEAVRMLLDGHSAGSVASRLGVSCPATIRRDRVFSTFACRRAIGKRIQEDLRDLPANLRKALSPEHQINM